jgi:penicillin-binding protein 1C
MKRLFRSSPKTQNSKLKTQNLLPRVLLTLIAVPLLLGGAALAWLVHDLPSVDGLQHRAAFASTRILDRHGTLLYELFDPQGGQRTLVPLAEVPAVLRDATISTEDASFYRNPGLDPVGLLRALWLNLTSGRVLAGGSTITQQLARAVLLSPEEAQQRTVARKAREAVLAYRIEQRYTKDQILEMYLNQVYYGNMAYGVEAASRAYFGKPVRDLDLAEAALLAGLPQAPSAYDPSTDPGTARARQRVVLDLMVKHGYLTQAQADTAAAEPLGFAPQRFPITAPHFVMYVRGVLEEQLGRERLVRGGLTVETTLDSDMQAATERIVREHLAGLTEQHVTNAAVVVLDPATGEILTMLGSADYFDKTIDGEVNVALAPRQPGSSIKPLTYALGLAGDMTAATVLPDIPTTYPAGAGGDGQAYEPLNYDRQFHGPQRLRPALANSYNVPAVYVLNRIGVHALFAAGRAAGLTTWEDESRFGLALTLGGGEVRLLEHTALYAAFARDGVPLAPFALARVRDSTGRVLIDATADRAALPRPPPLFGPRSAQVSWLMSDILSDNDARLPAFGPASPLRLTRQAAVKTGTTTNYRDNWTLGYTPDYVVGVWAGNSDNTPMLGVGGVTGAAPIWHDVMELIHQGRPERWFPRPAGLEQVEICALSGLLPGPACADRAREWFLAGTAPVLTDTWHVALEIDPATGLLAPPDCPAGAKVARTYTVPPPEYAAWAAGAGWELPPLAYTSICAGQGPNVVQAAITRPAAHAFVRNVVQIEGVIEGTGVAGYRLEVGEGAAPTRWREVATGTSAPGQRVLGAWETAGLHGQYTLRMTVILAGGGERVIRNRVTVDNAPPAAWIVWPGDGDDLSDLGPGERIVFQAEAQDDYGVAAVLFSADGRPLGRRAGAPWSLLLDPAALGPGAHRLTVTALDQAGNQSQPATITIKAR